MNQQQLQFNGVGYLTEWIVEGSDVYVIFKNKIIKEIKCASHEEAETVRTRLVNGFWNGRLN